MSALIRSPDVSAQARRPGVLVPVVGPSGAGKDTLIDSARAQFVGRPDILFVRRCITRNAGAGGEMHDALSREEFDHRRAAGGFLLSWEAHGHGYGIPIAHRADLEAGRTVVFNGSRRMVAEAEAIWPAVFVLEVMASPRTLAARLVGRGRETEEEIAQRLAREAPLLTRRATLVRIDNDGPLEAAVQAFCAALERACQASSS